MNEQKGVAKDFVFAGVRVNRDNKKTLQIIVIEDGKLGESMHFPYKRNSHKILGQVYTGASFSENMAHGLNLAKWVGPWKDTSDMIEWTAKEKEALAELAIAKLETDAKAKCEIERALVPLRRAYFKMYDKFDTDGCRALREAVLAELTRKPKKVEQ